MHNYMGHKSASRRSGRIRINNALIAINSRIVGNRNLATLPRQSFISIQETKQC